MENTQLIFRAKTHRGNVRRRNEDSVWPDERTTVHPYQDHPLGQLFIVADGMGGQGAGDVASQIAVKTVPQVYYEQPEMANLDYCLKTAIETAHQVIQREALKSAQVERMGSTVVVAVIKRSTLTVAWAGDSRCYLLHNQKLEQLTQDHTVLWPKIVSGQLDWKDVHTHPKRSQVTNALTAQSATVEIEFEHRALQPGDQILLCSDGLSSEVPDETIQDVLLTYPPDEAIEVLEEKARNPKTWPKDGDTVHTPGGEDNITSLIIELPGGSSRPKRRKVPQKLFFISKVVLATLGILVVVGRLIWFSLFKDDAPTPTSQAIIVNISTSLPTSTVIATTTEVKSNGGIPAPTPTLSTPEPTLALFLPLPTPIPTNTSTPTPSTPEPTLALFLPLPTPTSTNTSTPVPTPSPTPLSASSLEKTEEVTATIQLLSPISEASFPEGFKEIIFEWRAIDNLTEGERFLLQIWQEGEEPLGAMNAVEEEPNCQNSSCSYIIGDLQSAEGVRGAESGLFNWRVIVVKILPEYNPTPLTQSETRSFILGSSTGSGGSGGSETGNDNAAQKP